MLANMVPFSLILQAATLLTICFVSESGPSAVSISNNETKGVPNSAWPWKRCKCPDGYCDEGTTTCKCHQGWGYVPLDGFTGEYCKKCDCGAGIRHSCTFWYFFRNAFSFRELGQKCLCEDGFQIDADKCIATCDTNPCKNKGICVVKGEDIECKCQGGFTGERCELLDKPAIDQKCMDICGVNLGEQGEVNCNMNDDGEIECFCPDKNKLFDNEGKTCNYKPELDKKCVDLCGVHLGEQGELYCSIKEDEETECICSDKNKMFDEEGKTCKYKPEFNEKCENICGVSLDQEGEVTCKIKKDGEPDCICSDSKKTFDGKGKPCKFSDQYCHENFPNCLSTGGKCINSVGEDILCKCPKKTTFDPNLGCLVAKEYCHLKFPKCVDTDGKCIKLEGEEIKCKCPENTAFDPEIGCSEKEPDSCEEKFRKCRETEGEFLKSEDKEIH